MNNCSKIPPVTNPIPTSPVLALRCIFGVSVDYPIQPHRTDANMKVSANVRREPVQPRIALPVPHRGRPSTRAANPGRDAARSALGRPAFPAPLANGAGGDLPDVLRAGLVLVRHGEGRVEVLDLHLERTCAVTGVRRSGKRGAVNPKIPQRVIFPFWVESYGPRRRAWLCLDLLRRLLHPKQRWLRLRPMLL
jgi:hypothetical protein